MIPRIIIRLENGRIKTIHGNTWVEVSIIHPEAKSHGDGDAAYVNALEHETKSMQKIYPARKPRRHPRA